MFAGTTRVVPNATVCGTAGTGCSRARSSASISTGGRFVVRWARVLTFSQNASHAASSSAKLPYSSRRLVSLGTRSALLIFTDDSVPPLDAGSAGTQVCTTTE